MGSGLHVRIRIPRLRIETWGTRLFVGLIMLVSARSTWAQEDATVTAAPIATAKLQELDRVIAVVNNQVILASDLNVELRLFRLLPINDRRDSSPPKALERLTTRALIEQQILQEDPHGLEIAPKDLEDSLTELRQNLPQCKHTDCASAAGWSAYLATIGLTPERVADYWRHRMAMLRFIEERFRSGIHIAPEEIQKYYNETLAPQYAKPEEVPPLARVSPRIQEILLQQQVNALFNDWLKSLQEQGQVEILDPALATKENPAVPPPAHPVPRVPVPVPVPAPKPAAPASPGTSSPGNGGEL